MLKETPSQSIEELTKPRIPEEIREREAGMHSSIRESDLSPENWRALNKFCKETSLPIEAFYYDRNLENGIIYNNAMSLEGNESVTKLPENLTIGGYLNISGCKNLESIPRTLYVRGQIIIREREGLQDQVIKDAAFLIQDRKVENGLGGISLEVEEWQEAEVEVDKARRDRHTSYIKSQKLE